MNARWSARSTGDEEPPAISSSSTVVLRQVASRSLAGAAPISALGPEAASRIVDEAARERLLGPLLSVVDSGELDVPDEVLRRIVERHRTAMRWCTRLEARLFDIDDWFREAGGARYLVIKGPAVAHLDEPDPSMRSFHDLDLLVLASDLDRAIVTLERNGATRRVAQRRPGFDRRYIKSVGMRTHDSVEVDVHRSLVGGPHGFRIPLDRVFAGAERFEVGGVGFLAPGLGHRALHAAYHAVVGSTTPPLRTLRDLGGYLTRSDLSVGEVVEEARRWRGEAVLFQAVRATFDTLTFDAPLWRDWLHTYRPDPEEMTLIRKGHEAKRWPMEWTTVRELPWRDRLAFSWAVAVPSKASWDERGISPITRLRIGLARVARPTSDVDHR